MMKKMMAALIAVALMVSGGTAAMAAPKAEKKPAAESQVKSAKKADSAKQSKATKKQATKKSPGKKAAAKKAAKQAK